MTGICVQPSNPRARDIADWHLRCPYSKGNTNNSWILFINTGSNMTLVVWHLGDDMRRQPNFSFCCRIDPFNDIPGIDAFFLMGQQGCDRSGCTLQESFLM
jgi:hypothetical protein